MRTQEAQQRREARAAQHRRVVELYLREGVTPTAIAARFGLTRFCVHRILRAAGVTTRRETAGPPGPRPKQDSNAPDGLVQFLPGLLTEGW